MKNQNYNSASQLNSLIWVKRSNYKQKSVSDNYSIHHMDLSWIKVKGYQQKNNVAEQVQMSMTAYQGIELLKAQHKFYSVAMAAMMISLVLLASSF